MRWIQFKEHHTPYGKGFAHDVYVTMSEETAVADYRRLHPERDVSDWVALDGYMSRRNARFVPEPIGKGKELSEYMSSFVARHGSITKAAKALNVHYNVVKDTMDGKREKLPTHVLRSLGDRVVWTLMDAAPAEPVGEPA